MGGGLIDMEQKGCESTIHDRDLWVTMMGWGWMYCIVTGVTSDVGVPSTSLVCLEIPDL